MEKKESKPKKVQARRNFLKKGLIVSSGLAFGHSLIQQVWAADYTIKKKAGNVRAMPAKAMVVRKPGHLTISRAQRSQAANSIAPTLKTLLKNAGVTAKPAEMNEIVKALSERGTITVPGRGGNVASTLTIGGSMTWK